MVTNKIKNRKNLIKLNSTENVYFILNVNPNPRLDLQKNKIYPLKSDK